MLENDSVLRRVDENLIFGDDVKDTFPRGLLVSIFDSFSSFWFFNEPHASAVLLEPC